MYVSETDMTSRVCNNKDGSKSARLKIAEVQFVPTVGAEERLRKAYGLLMSEPHARSEDQMAGQQTSEHEGMSQTE